MARPRLSLCAATISPPARVIAFLDAWRPHVEEIVLAVDEHAPAATAEQCAALTDRLEVVPHMATAEHYIGWLLAQCSGEWILRMDDDELPTDALLAELPGLLASREHTHHLMARRWVYPDATRTISSGPWVAGYDLHARLVRNITGLWHVPSQLHGHVRVEGAGRIAAAPFLHLATVADDLAARRRKVERYEQLAPGLELPTGGSVNSLYLPEDVPDLQTTPLTDGDGARVRAYLEAVWSAGPVNGARPPLTVDRSELERWHTPAPMTAAGSRAEIRLLEQPTAMPTGGTQEVLIEVRNTGTGTWAPGPDIVVAHAWRRPDGSALEAPTPRTHFTERVEPGATTRVLVTVLAPDEPGDHLLAIDVVQELVRWFGCEITCPVTVAAPSRKIRRTPRQEAGAVLRADGPRVAARHPLRTARLLRHARSASVRGPIPAKERADVFARDLRLLHDILDATPFGGRYWVWSGLLLGWAREGALLAHDLHDADFGFLPHDAPLFPDAARALMRGGFAPLHRFVNNAGEVTEYTFTRHDAKFEFWMIAPRADRLRHYAYSDGGPGGPPTQVAAEISFQRLDHFRFLGRRWRKHVDHELELTQLYGDWRTPDETWDYMRGRAIVDRRPWRDPRYRWSGDLP